MLRRKSGRGRRLAAGSAVLTALAVAVTGCSGGGSARASASGSATTPPASTQPSATTTSSEPQPSTAATTPSAPPPSTTAAATTSSSVSQLSGTYLKTLLPVTDTENMLGLGPGLPTGWVARTTKEHDSGPTATPAAPSLVGAGDCNYLVTQDLDLAGGLSVASATEPLGSGTAGVGLAFYAYQPGDAAKSLAQVRQNLASSCDSFLVLPHGGAGGGQVRVNVSATPVTGLGDEALLVKTTPEGPYIDQENLLVRRGNLMLSLWSDNVFGDLPDLKPVATALVTVMG